MGHTESKLSEKAMHAKREEHSKPDWSGDQLDAAFPPEFEAPYFDEVLEHGY